MNKAARATGRREVGEELMSLLCQSCGMPFSRSGLAHGHESDGSPSADYCALCYDGGVFLQPAMKRTSMQHLVMHSFEREGWPKAAAWAATRHIAFLKRWRRA